MKWGSDGYGHMSHADGHMMKHMARYRGVLVAKERNKKLDKPIYYIEGLSGEYNRECELTSAIDRLLKYQEVDNG